MHNGDTRVNVSKMSWIQHTSSLHTRKALLHEYFLKLLKFSHNCLATVKWVPANALGTLFVDDFVGQRTHLHSWHFVDIDPNLLFSLIFLNFDISWVDTKLSKNLSRLLKFSMFAKIKIKSAFLSLCIVVIWSRNLLSRKYLNSVFSIYSVAD